MASSSASEIVKQIGGTSNIVGLTHCATRLRFELNDSSVVNKAEIEAIPGVLGAVPQAGNRYQVVIGGAVATVYDDIMKIPGIGQAPKMGSAEDIAAQKAQIRGAGPRAKFSWLDSLFEYLSDSFRPIIGVLLGASLIIAFMAVMASLHVIPAWNSPGVTLAPSWQFVNLAWKSVFVFLPLYVAYNASKKLGADPWVGFAIMGVVMLPGFTALGTTDGATTLNFIAGNTVQVVQVFGLPLTVFDYSSQVFPPLLMAALLGPLYKWLRKVIPENVQLVFVPFLSMIVMIPLTAFLIGPIGVYVGAGLAQVLSAINSFSPLIFAIVIPLAYPFMVPLGLHWPINAIMLLNIQTLGFDYIQGPMGAWNFACFGATAAVLVLATREKDDAMRQTATGALAAGLFGGISEPSLYGIHLRYKRIYPRMLVGCGVGGLIMGLFGGVHTSVFAFTSLLTIPVFDNVWVYSLGIAAAFAISMTLVLISGYKTPENSAVAAAGAAESVAAPTTAGAAPAAAAAGTATATAVGTLVATVGSPVEGIVIPLADVPDPVFSKGIVGPGVGVDPTGDTVYAPADGKVVVAQPTGHAFGLLLDSGVELLIHIGIDTVNLQGKGFDVKVKAGDVVTAGTPLVTFDRAVIEEAGYSLVTPVLVTNHAKFAAVEQVGNGHVAVGDALLTVSK